jgi:hypothetical protein
MSPTLENRVFYHLSSILYPPLSEKYTLPAIRAIQLARAGLSEYKVRLPSGRWVKACKFIDYLFLSGFVNNLVD